LDGVFLIGLALLVHAWNLPFYRRHPPIRWLLICVGSSISLASFILTFLVR
jgi:hypothetical protein